MMIGENFRSNPTVQIPPWEPSEDPTAGINSPYSIHSPSALVNAAGAGAGDYLAALYRYLPSNESDSLIAAAAESDPLEGFRCDHFRMYVFKVKKCARGRSHDWTECPFAHPGEKARRRDPQRFQYSGTPCPDFRKGVCRKGDSCEYAHGVFECWLHPDRYRTQPCKDGLNCRRRVCFFAHTPDQLRAVPQQSPRNSGAGEGDYGSPIRHSFDSYLTKPASFLTSPTSILTSPPLSPPADSPPMSPSRHNLLCGGSPRSMADLISSMRGLGFGNMPMSPRGHVGFGSLRCSNLHPGATLQGRPVAGFDLWGTPSEPEEAPMERVESGRDLRARMYAKLSKENSLDQVETGPVAGPDLGWVSELVK